MELENDFGKLLKPLRILLNKEEININSKHLKPKSDKKCTTREEETKSKRSPTSLNTLHQHLCSHPGCNKLFGKQSRLVVHERTHTGERPFKCPHENCHRSYTRQFHLTRHLAVSHTPIQENAKESRKCEQCNKLFTNLYSLKKHETHIHDSERYTCRECGHMFKKQQHLKTHSFVHTGIKPFECNFPGCEGKFELPSRLKRHSLSHVRGRYLCMYDDCSVQVDTYTLLRQHLARAHPKICDHCGKEFSMISRLQTHMESHKQVREAFFCPHHLCERYYFDERNLQQHICTKHDKHFKGYECPVCDKWLVTKQKLQFHLRTHALKKPALKAKRRKKVRKERKDKGVSKTDFAKLLSGYSSEEGADGVEDMGETEGGGDMECSS